ncbi:MAG: hypothetical protein ACK58P_08860, partial [Betaproteobacteria bacterium]
GQIDADGSTLVHDFPSWFQLMTQDLNRGTSMPCDFAVASGRGSPSYSVKLTRYGRLCKPGPRHYYYRRVPGLQSLPPRAA